MDRKLISNSSDNQLIAFQANCSAFGLQLLRPQGLLLFFVVHNSTLYKMVIDLTVKNWQTMTVKDSKL